MSAPHADRDRSEPAARDADNTPSDAPTGQGAELEVVADAPSPVGSVEDRVCELAEAMHAIDCGCDEVHPWHVTLAHACVAVEERRTAELRAEVERQAVLLRAINDCHLDPARAILQADKIAGAAILRAEKAEAGLRALRPPLQRAEATLARVEALADELIASKGPHDTMCGLLFRNALRGPVPTEDGAP